MFLRAREARAYGCVLHRRTKQIAFIVLFDSFIVDPL